MEQSPDQHAVLQRDTDWHTQILSYGRHRTPGS